MKLRGNHNPQILVFETADEYMLHNSVEGFWGPVQSSIDWCERNYVVSYYVAEFYNTTSNIVLLLFGLWGIQQCRQQQLETRFWIVYAGISVIGVGSASFHGTLSHIGQQVKYYLVIDHYTDSNLLCGPQ